MLFKMIFQGYIVKVTQFKTVTFFWIQGDNRQYTLKPANNQLTIGSYIIVNGTLTEREFIVENIIYYRRVSTELKILPSLNCSEETVQRYPYLYSRFFPQFYNTIINRSQAFQIIRNFFISRNFLEIETPLLSIPASETIGAKGFLVNSIKKDYYFGLPQSPQIYKQILMYSGVPKYFQIAKCFRAEDLREDRQYEFLQIDVEYILEEVSLTPLIETAVSVIRNLINEFNGSLNILYEEVTTEEALERYGHLQIDLRCPCIYSLEEQTLSVPNIISFEFIDSLIRENESILPSTEFHILQNISSERVHSLLESIHTYYRNNVEYNQISIVVLTLPTAILDGVLALSPFNKLLDNNLQLSFDILLNGTEVCTGAVRETSPERFIDQLTMANVQNLTEYEFFIEALRTSTPLHGGFGLGFDRLLSEILFNTSNIRTVRFFNLSKSGNSFFENTPLKRS